MNRLFNEYTVERFEALTGERPSSMNPDDMELLWEIAAELDEQRVGARCVDCGGQGAYVAATPRDFLGLGCVGCGIAILPVTATPVRTVQAFELRMHAYYFGVDVEGPFGCVASTVNRFTSEVIG